jgi:hypothetical protein
MIKLIYRDNDNLIRVTGLRDISASGDYLNAATVTANLYDDDGNLVSQSGGITLSYVSGSTGDYEGVLQSTESLTVGDEYKLEIDADEGGAVGHWKVECEIVERNA